MDTDNTKPKAYAYLEPYQISMMKLFPKTDFRKKALSQMFTRVLITP